MAALVKYVDAVEDVGVRDLNLSSANLIILRELILPIEQPIQLYLILLLSFSFITSCYIVSFFIINKKYLITLQHDRHNANLLNGSKLFVHY